MAAAVVAAPPVAEQQSLEPTSVVRAAVLIQAAIRRFLIEDCTRLLDIQPTEPPPPAAVARYFSRRMRKLGDADAERMEAEAEAALVTAIICGRPKGLTVGSLVKTHAEYAKSLSPGHPVLEVLQERFKEVAAEAEEDLRSRLRGVTLPSEVRRQAEDCRRAWAVPAELPEGWRDVDPMLPASAAIAELLPATEEALASKLQLCSTQGSLKALLAEVEREFASDPTILRSQIRRAQTGQKEHVQLAVHTEYGWPPEGLPLQLASAARWYAHELGADHLDVEDFVAAARRACQRVEKAAIMALAPLEARLEVQRTQVTAQPPPPKLLLQGYVKDLQDAEEYAEQEVQDWWEQLGSESVEFFRCIRRILTPAAFLARCESEAGKAAADLEALGPHDAFEAAQVAQQRLAAASHLTRLLTVLQEEGSQRVEELKAGAAVDLEFARATADLMEDAVASELDGWHQPPGYRGIDHIAGLPPEALPFRNIPVAS